MIRSLLLFLRKKRLHLVVVLLIPLGFLLSPRPQHKLCSTYVTINEKLGFIINCDSYGFLDAAENPSLLLKKDFFWQSRPLYIFAGTIIGYPLSVVMNRIPPKNFQIPVVSNFPPINAPEIAKIHTVSYYLAFLFVNFGMLFASVNLLDKIIDLVSDSKFPLFLKSLLSIFVVSNIVTKSFVFSPHLQMMTIVCPLLCCYLALTIILKKHLDFNRLILIAFATGFLTLCYGSSILILPTIVFAFLYRKATNSAVSLTTIKQSMILVIAFISPLLIWILIVYNKNGSYYNPEISLYRQFVWIYDSISEGIQVFSEKLWIYTVKYVITMKVLVIPALFLIGLRFMSWRNKKNVGEEVSHKLVKRRTLFSILLIYFVFIWLINIAVERLTYNMFFILLCLISLEMAVLDSRVKFLNKKSTVFTGIILVVIWSVYNIASYGPFE